MNQSQQDFFQKVNEVTYPNPFNPRERVFNNIASFEIIVFYEKVHLKSIRSFEHGKGYGSITLKAITEIADLYSITLHLEPKSFGISKNSLSNAQLKKWYGRNGFKVDKKIGGMTRVPSK